MSQSEREAYFAAPLFSDSETRFNASLTERLERELGLNVFLPQRDGMEFARMQHMTPQEMTQAIFELDHDEVFASDIFVIVLDGRVPDEGAALELGLAYAHRELTGKKRMIVGLLTDVRASFINQQLNPMLEAPLDYIARGENELIEYVKKHIDTSPQTHSISH